MMFAAPLPESGVDITDVEGVERIEDAYLARLVGEALGEVEAGAQTVPWDQVKAELDG